jgi:hypothetical protein
MLLLFEFGIAILRTHKKEHGILKNCLNPAENIVFLGRVPGMSLGPSTEIANR